MASVPCTSCGVLLTAHCNSRTCRWWQCLNRGCEWSVYDLERGVRTSLGGTKVERLGAPPEAECDGA
jgi:hypothetical protein